MQHTFDNIDDMTEWIDNMVDEPVLKEKLIQEGIQYHAMNGIFAIYVFNVPYNKFFGRSRPDSDDLFSPLTT